MASTYEPIATTTLGSDTATISFTSIPGTYTDLRLVLVARTDRASTGNDTVLLRFNSDSGTNYSYTSITGNGTTATSSLSSTVAQIIAGYAPRNNNTSGIFGLTTVDIFSYAGSTYKTALCTGNSDLNGSGEVNRTVGLWRSTSAITSVTFSLSSTFKYLTGSTATLYGILRA